MTGDTLKRTNVSLRDTSSFRLYEHVALCPSERGDSIRFIRGSSAPRSNPSPFLCIIFLKVPFKIASDLLPNGTPFTYPDSRTLFSRLIHSHEIRLSALWAFLQRKMTDFSILLYTSASEIPTLSYTLSLKKVPLSGVPSPHRPS